MGSGGGRDVGADEREWAGNRPATDRPVTRRRRRLRRPRISWPHFPPSPPLGRSSPARQRLLHRSPDLVRNGMPSPWQARARTRTDSSAGRQSPYMIQGKRRRLVVILGASSSVVFCRRLISDQSLLAGPVTGLHRLRRPRLVVLQITSNDFMIILVGSRFPGAPLLA